MTTTTPTQYPDTVTTPDGITYRLPQRLTRPQHREQIRLGQKIVAGTATENDRHLYHRLGAQSSWAQVLRKLHRAQAAGDASAVEYWTPEVLRLANFCDRYPGLVEVV